MNRELFAFVLAWLALVVCIALMLLAVGCGRAQAATTMRAVVQMTIRIPVTMRGNSLQGALVTLRYAPSALYPLDATGPTGCMVVTGPPPLDRAGELKIAMVCLPARDNPTIVVPFYVLDSGTSVVTVWHCDKSQNPMAADDHCPAEGVIIKASEPKRRRP
jgi:hypothetical protein